MHALMRGWPEEVRRHPISLSSREQILLLRPSFVMPSYGLMYQCICASSHIRQPSESGISEWPSGAGHRLMIKDST